MSTWTHVVGSIRFDCLPGLVPEPRLGTTCSWNDNPKIWDACDVPCGSEGSEGSLQVVMHTVPGDTIAKYVATIFGDLRDYEDEQEVIKYFNRIVDGQWVRQGCFSFFVEGREVRTFVYDEGTQKFVER